MFSFFHSLFPGQKSVFTLLICCVQLIYWAVVAGTGRSELRSYSLTTGIVTERGAVSYFNPQQNRKRLFSDMLVSTYKPGERLDVLYSNETGGEYAYGYFGFWLYKLIIHSVFSLLLSLLVTMIYFISQLKPQ